MLPIFAVTGRAVWFVASNFFTLFRLAWLPVAALIAAQYGLAYGVVHLSPGLNFEALQESDVFAAGIGAGLSLQGLAFSVIAVAVHRIILFGDRRPDEYFSFPFGKTEFLYVLMGALSFVAIAGLVAMLAFGAGFLAVLADVDISDLDSEKGAPAGITIALAVLGLVGYVALIWLTMRLTVWPPAVVANNKLSFGEAWSLSKGNVLALFGLSIASTVTFVALGGVVVIAASQTCAADALDLAKQLAFDAATDAKIARILEGKVNPQVVAFEFAFQFFVTTYTVAVLSYAYKALKGLDIDSPIDQQPAGAFEPGMKPLGAL